MVSKVKKASSSVNSLPKISRDLFPFSSAQVNDQSIQAGRGGAGRRAGPIVVTLV